MLTTFTRRLALGAVSALALSALGAAAQDGPLAGKDVAFVLWGFDGYQQGQGNWFMKAATDAGAANVRLIDGKVDPQVQLKAIDDLIAAGVDGIAYQPVEPAAAVPSVKAAQAAGIPLILIGAMPDPSAAVAPAALFNDYDTTFKAGQNAANWLKTNKPGEKAKLVIFDVMTLGYCRDGRMQGFIDGVTDVMGADMVEIKFRDTVEHKREVSLAKMEDLLTRDPDFNIFTACGADGVLGGIAALQAAGRAQAVNKVPQTEYIFSIDGTPSELELLFNPASALVETMTMTPKENGIVAKDLLRQVMTGELAPDANTVLSMPGVLLPASCEGAAAILQEQYGLNADFQPLDCSKYQ
jgi:ABC-type sugar transport system substrate-binding protein